MTTRDTIYLLLPELVLVLSATFIYVAGAFWPERRGWNWAAAFGLLAAAAVLFAQWKSPNVRTAIEDGLFSGPIVVDLLSMFSRASILAVGLLFVMIASRTASETQEPEFMGSLLLLLTGLNLVALSNDLVMVFLGLEMVSIPTYLLLFVGSGHIERYNAQRQEAATKYFFLSLLSSAVLLYGFSFFYGVTGSTRLDVAFDFLNRAKDNTPGSDLLTRLAMVLIFAGLGFRLAVVPFHFYAPDVYQGTSNPNAGLLAVMPKIAGLLALVRLVMVAMPGEERIGWQLTLAVAVVTMTLGNLLALWQSNIRRMLAYSSIANAGYMLIGLSVAFATASGTQGIEDLDGLGATFFYLIVYSLATAGTFAAITFLGGPRTQIDTVDDLAGLGQTNPRSAIAIAVFMFSLAGLPPLAGFWGKFGLLTGALGVQSLKLDMNAENGNLMTGLRPWFVMLAIVTVLNAAIAAAYYLRVVAAMYFKPALSTRPAQGGIGAAAAMIACAAMVVGIGIHPGPWQDGAQSASTAAHQSFQRNSENLVRERTSSTVADSRPVD